MYPIKLKTIKFDEFGLIFVNGKFKRLIGEGLNCILDFSLRTKVEVYNQREAWILSNELDQLRDQESLKDKIEFVDLKDHHRALVSIDGRMDSILDPGLYALWKTKRKISVEVFDIRSPKIERDDIEKLTSIAGASRLIQASDIPEGKEGLLFINGKYSETLKAGKYAFWNGSAKIKVYQVDLREQVMDVAGQEIMTQDKVTLRLNAVISYKITDSVKSFEIAEDPTQVLYREAQLALREQIGRLKIDELLGEKEEICKRSKQQVSKVAADLGIQITSLGVRDVILPGDMKEILNKVILAQKESEANSIKRREETAAMRSQLNTAKLMETNPTLMRLRELEVLELVAQTSNLNVILGEKGLTDKLTKMI